MIEARKEAMADVVTPKNFWRDLPDCFSVLAPMEDVTDSVFRRVILSAGAPDVLFTEFTNCDGICSIGQAKVIHRLFYTKAEIEARPLVAQIWGKTVDNYRQTAKLCLEMGFSGVDINMGCPEKNVIKQGACSALINNPTLAKQIIDAVQEGVGGAIPVSVKTRIGFKDIATKDWIGFLLQQNIQALTVHGRTVSELSDVPNHFEELEFACKLAKEKRPDLKFIANGDILGWQDGEKMCLNDGRDGYDGYMVGRGVFKNPWCFNKDIQLILSSDGNSKIPDVTKEQRFEMLKLHLDLWDQTWQEPRATKNYATLKKYFKIYINNFPEANELRGKLMDTKSLQEAKDVLTSFLI